MVYHDPCEQSTTAYLRMQSICQYGASWNGLAGTPAKGAATSKTRRPATCGPAVSCRHTSLKQSAYLAAALFLRTAERTMFGCLAVHIASYVMMRLVQLLARIEVIA